MREELSFECFCALRKLGRKLIGLSRQNFTEMGYQWNQYEVIKCIKPGESIILTDISNRISVKCSNVTGIVDALVEKGILKRSSDINDRRVIRISLTQDGVAIRKNLLENHKVFINKLFIDVEEEKMVRFIELAKHIYNKIEE